MGKGRACVMSAGERRAFLAALAVTCNVTRSAQLAGSCYQRAYETRARDAKFRAAWARAIAEGFARLELKMLQRALGQEEELPPEVRQAAEGTKEPSDRVMLTLLSHHRAAAEREDARQAEAKPRGGDPRIALVARLKKMRAAMLASEAAADSATARGERPCSGT